MDFSAINSLTDSGDIGDTQAAIDMYNDRSICYFTRGKTVAEVNTILSGFVNDTDYYCLVERVNRGTFVFLDSPKHTGIEMALYEDDGTILEPEWSAIEAVKASLRIRTELFADSFSQGNNLGLPSITPDVGTDYSFLYQNNGGNLGVFTGGLCKVFEPDGEQGVLINCNATYSNDHAVELKVELAGDNGQCVLFVRGTNNDSYYTVFADVSESLLFMNDFGLSPMGISGSGIKTGDIIRLQVKGDNISFWINDKKILSENDLNHATGKAGIGMGSIIFGGYQMDYIYKNVRIWDVP